MVVDPMWAGQYLLLDELWRGRERIVFDPLLNQLILAPGGDELAWDREGRVHEMLEALLAQDSAGVWLLFENLHRVARAGVDPSLFGARALHDGPLLALRRHWEVAMVDVTRLLDSMGAASRSDSHPELGLAPEASLVDALLTSLEDDRSLVLWTRADANAPGDSARIKSLFQLFRDAPGASKLEPQLVGVSRAPMLQAYPLSNRRHEDCEGVEVDNRLGTDFPDFCYYMAVLGPQVPAGVTLVELPMSSEWGSQRAGTVERRSPERRTLRDRLDFVEQELEASERSRLDILRDLDQATQHVAELEDELDDLRDAPGLREAAVPEEASPSIAADESHAQALLLTASWELESLRAQLQELRSRPVDALEAENARLRAALRSLSSPQSVQELVAGKGAQLSDVEQASNASDPRLDPACAAHQSSLVQQGSHGRAPDVKIKAWQPELRAIASELRALRARAERGGMEPLSLQSKLRELEGGVERILRDDERREQVASSSCATAAEFHDSVG